MRVKKFPIQISLIFKLVTQIRRADQQKVAWFESDFSVSSASHY